jgi:hypothetical protein
MCECGIIVAEEERLDMAEDRPWEPVLLIAFDRSPCHTGGFHVRLRIGGEPLSDTEDVPVGQIGMGSGISRIQR